MKLKQLIPALSIVLSACPESPFDEKGRTPQEVAVDVLTDVDAVSGEVALDAAETHDAALDAIDADSDKPHVDAPHPDTAGQPQDVASPQDAPTSPDLPSSPDVPTTPDTSTTPDIPTEPDSGGEEPSPPPSPCPPGKELVNFYHTGQPENGPPGLLTVQIINFDAVTGTLEVISTLPNTPCNETDLDYPKLCVFYYSACLKPGDAERVQVKFNMKDCDSETCPAYEVGIEQGSAEGTTIWVFCPDNGYSQSGEEPGFTTQYLDSGGYLEAMCTHHVLIP